MILNINTDAVVKHSAQLEKLRKSAIPLAVRGALNDAAFDVKTKTMLKQAKSRFISRTINDNFFRANSRVEKATGFEVNSMKSLVGFFSNNLRSDRGAEKDNFAVKDLEAQEYGKRIDAKSFIPLDSARTGGIGTLVKAPNRIGRILPGSGSIKERLKNANVIIARNLAGASKKEQFIRAIFKAGAGGYLIGDKEKGQNLLYRVDSLDIETRRFKLTPLYSYKPGRGIRVKQRNFMRTASNESAAKLEKFYIKQAEFWIKKFSA